ncbi:MAG: hypothetical protein M1387_05360, partial [Thaumarchaeota archaeon]|nr:hypothetical protein [Nitrososphaerota archaeon]
TISAQQPVSAYNYSEHTLESKTNLQMRVSRLEEAEQLQLHLTCSTCKDISSLNCDSEGAACKQPIFC